MTLFSSAAGLFVVSLAITVASAVYQRRQQKKAEEAAKDAANAQKGYQLST